MAYPFPTSMCFSDGTLVYTIEQKTGRILSIRIADVKAGTKVLAVDSAGNRMQSEVILNDKLDGEFAFISVFVASANGEQYSITITENHWMIRAPPGLASDEVDRWETCMASTLQIDDVVPISDVFHEIKSGDVAYGRITRLERTTRAVKYDLVTQEGTVLADGIACTTMCHKTPISWNVSGMPLVSTLAEWRELHAAPFEKLRAKRGPVAMTTMTVQMEEVPHANQAHNEPPVHLAAITASA